MSRRMSRGLLGGLMAFGIFALGFHEGLSPVLAGVIAMCGFPVIGSLSEMVVASR